MNPIVFASSNPNKISEITGQVEDGLEIISLSELELSEELEEPYKTFQQNAAYKCEQIYSQTLYDCFAEDSGLEVAALGGDPGVYSARYAGEGREDQKNIEKVLQNMQGKQDRRAQFRTVLCWLRSGNFYFFEGYCKGVIADEPRGEQGFGYDPIFIPEGSDLSFGQMTMDEKKKFSHRAKATAEFLDFIKVMGA